MKHGKTSTGVCTGNGLLRRTTDQKKFEEIHDVYRARDILQHFYCDVFHLKDWIFYADSQTQAIKDAVSRFLPKGDPNPPSLAMAICARHCQRL